MGLTCLLEYFYAAQLRPLICLCESSYSAHWKELEIRLIGDIPIAAMVTDNEIQKRLNIDNPLIDLQLEIWRKTEKLCRIESLAKLLQWPAYDTDF